MLMGRGLSSVPSVCLEPRCPNLATVRGRCAEHQASKRVLERRHYTGIPGVNYGRRWRVSRELYLATHPFCVECHKAGRRLVAATQLDHITPHEGDYALFWDESNWQGLCESCHSAKTAREVGLGR